MREQESKSLVQKKSFFSPRKVAGNGGLTVLFEVHKFFARAERGAKAPTLCRASEALLCRRAPFRGSGIYEHREYMTKGLKNTALIINPSAPSALVRMGHLPLREGK